jgi:probable F420-dependent oxidoreductase
VEDLGFESFWAPEHVAVPYDDTVRHRLTGAPLPDVYGEMPDPFVTLAAMAATTKRIRLGTAVCLATARHPLVLAKTAASVDQLSGGRLELGIGAGWIREEVELAGVPFKARWQYTAEAIEGIKRAWVDGHTGFSGELIQGPDMVCHPTPVQRPHPPIHIGAQPGPRAAQRVAELGDGWVVMGVTPSQVAEAKREIAAACAKHDRDPSRIEISVGVRDPSPEVSDAYAAAGVDRLIVALYNHTGEPVGIDNWSAATAAAITSDPPSPSDTLRALEAIHRMAAM